ncbi:MAG: ABC transporter ATP-binding protein [Clostridiales bacterium]|nr:ABC transporter ATP-binding protein [Clostridiales bacterium]
MIRLENITCSYGEKTPVKDLTLTLPDTGVVGIFGPSGRGKTTLLRLLSGRIEPKAGEISGLTDKRVSVVFQEDRLLPWRTALENVAIVKDSSEVQAKELLASMELVAETDKLPRELSGGMQRRVALARALNFGGDILLLDEPFKGLDEALRLRIIERVKGSFPLIVIATHDRAEAELLGMTKEVIL